MKKENSINLAWHEGKKISNSTIMYICANILFISKFTLHIQIYKKKLKYFLRIEKVMKCLNISC